MSYFLQNLNDNLLCAFWVETTGPKPNFHDILQIAIIPLDFDLGVHKDYMPFFLDIKPKRLHNCNKENGGKASKEKIVKALSYGLDSFEAQDAFVGWFENLKISYNRQLMPLGCNWSIQRGFIVDWLGPETTKMYIHNQYRDILPCATFQNDRSGLFGEDFLYPEISMTNLVSRFNLDWDRTRDAAESAYTVAQIYYRLLQQRQL